MKNKLSISMVLCVSLFAPLADSNKTVVVNATEPVEQTVKPERYYSTANNYYYEIENTDLEREAAELYGRYTKELNQHKIRTLSEQLSQMDEDDEDYEPLLRQIQELQTTGQ